MEFEGTVSEALLEIADFLDKMDKLGKLLTLEREGYEPQSLYEFLGSSSVMQDDLREIAEGL